MNISTRTIAGATATLARLLVATACGSETVSDTDPGTAPVANRIYPPTSIPPAPVEVKKGVRCPPTPQSAQPRRRRLVRTPPPPLGGLAAARSRTSSRTPDTPAHSDEGRDGSPRSEVRPVLRRRVRTGAVHSVRAGEVEADDAGDDQCQAPGLHPGEVLAQEQQSDDRDQRVPAPAHTAYATETGICLTTTVSIQIERP